MLVRNPHRPPAVQWKNDRGNPRQSTARAGRCRRFGAGGAGTAALEAICLRTMATRTEDRYGSARELADNVDRWLADEPVRACREPLSTRLARWVRRHKPIVAGAVSLLATATIALAAGLARRACRATTDWSPAQGAGRCSIRPRPTLGATAQKRISHAPGDRREMVRQAGDTPMDASRGAAPTASRLARARFGRRAAISSAAGAPGRCLEVLPKFPGPREHRCRDSPRDRACVPKDRRYLSRARQGSPRPVRPMRPLPRYRTPARIRKSSDTTRRADLVPPRTKVRPTTKSRSNSNQILWART